MTPEQWRRIEDLYHSAQECSPDERAALLDQADPEIRFHIQRMLAIDSSDQLLDQPAAALLSHATKTVVAAGTQFGPYKIEAEIGAGGMGTVYRALDTRLGRVVAIKIASERYSERFQLEARAISTLNHPYVCTLYDVGPNYLVMEFIEGSTLAREVQKGPFAPEMVARYGAQIASALAEAHRLGIVHRDLKPSNIMVTRHGVKVLDFGLAKMLWESGISDLHAIMGTPAYMAPEQVEGREPTSSTDLFALGLVLYEMLIGRLPFPGASLGQMLSSGSVTAVPALSQQRVEIPASLDALVKQLLQRDLAQRPGSAHEVAEALSASSGPVRSQLKWRPAFTIPALLFAVSLIAAMLWLARRERQSAPAGPLNIRPDSYAQITSFTDSAVGPALSSDGKLLAFFRSDNWFITPDQIWIKLLPNGDPVQLTHDSRPKYNLSFSPDGSRIAYTVLQKGFDSYTVSSLGGEPQLMLSNAAGLSWLSERQLLFSRVKTGLHMGIATSALDGSDLREIYFPSHERGMAHYSYPSPDHKWVLVVEMDPDWEPCRLVPFAGASQGRQVGPTGQCSGAAWSPNGRWMYFTVEVSRRSHLWRQRFPDGKPEQISSGSVEEYGVTVAPDGRSLITSAYTQQNAVWIHDGRGARPISTEGYGDFSPPIFSKNGKRVYYLLRRTSLDSPFELWRFDVVSGKTELMLPGVSMRDYDISDDENEVVYSTEPAGQASQLWIASLDRSKPPRRISATGEAFPHFGPHGEVLFRMTDGKAFYIGSMARDGSGRVQKVSYKFLDLTNFSPDRKFVIAATETPGSGSRGSRPTLVVPLEGGPAKKICDILCFATWSPDGRYFFVEIAPATREDPAGKVVAIPVPRGASLPALPADSRGRTEDWLKMPGSKVVEQDYLAPGLNLSTYAYVKAVVHANLFRVPLP